MILERRSKGFKVHVGLVILTAASGSHVLGAASGEEIECRQQPSVQGLVAMVTQISTATPPSVAQ